MLALCTAFSPRHASAEPRPWVGAGEMPIPEWVRSAEVTRPDEPLYQGPSSAEKRRGAAARGARLPVFGARRGPGCAGKMQELIGRADAAVTGKPAAKVFAQAKPTLWVLPDQLTTEEYGIAVRKDTPELRDAVNVALKKIKADGTYDKLVQKWFEAGK